MNLMETPGRQQTHSASSVANFPRWFKEDAEAVEFAERLWTAMQDWDEIEDTGKARNLTRLVFWMCGKEHHPFFIRYAHLLRPLFLLLNFKRRTARVLEDGNIGDPMLIRMLREEAASILHMMAWICGGEDWAAEVSPEIYGVCAPGASAEVGGSSNVTLQ